MGVAKRNTSTNTVKGTRYSFCYHQVSYFGSVPEQGVWFLEMGSGGRTGVLWFAGNRVCLLLAVEVQAPSFCISLFNKREGGAIGRGECWEGWSIRKGVEHCYSFCFLSFPFTMAFFSFLSFTLFPIIIIIVIFLLFFNFCFFLTFSHHWEGWSIGKGGSIPFPMSPPSLHQLKHAST